MTPQDDPIIPYGYCHCGCGEKTKISFKTSIRHGYTKGHPVRYVMGHNRRGSRMEEPSLVKMRARARHGHAREDRVSSTWKSWRSMKERCFNPKASGFERYGGRGITVCRRWLLFDDFLSDMGEKPDGLTIERIDNNGNYEPGNCRWATYREQAYNRKDTCVFDFRGIQYTTEGLMKISGMNFNTLKARLRKWSVEEAMTRPLRQYRCKR